MSQNHLGLEVRSVTHHYRRRSALNDVSFSFGAGVTGLLGENGAGKSTLMKLITGAVRLQEGEILLGGTPLADQQRSSLVGYLPQSFDTMPWATVQRNVEYAAWAHGVSADECSHAAAVALERVGLSDRITSRANQLSGGQRQRLGIACVLANRPELVLLDEPTVGLDPTQRVALRQVIEEIANDAIVIMSTHIVEDIGAFGGDVAVLHEGSSVWTGTVDDMAQRGERNPIPGMSTLESGYTSTLVKALV